MKAATLKDAATESANPSVSHSQARDLCIFGAGPVTQTLANLDRMRVDLCLIKARLGSLELLAKVIHIRLQCSNIETHPIPPTAITTTAIIDMLMATAATQPMRKLTSEGDSSSSHSADAPHIRAVVMVDVGSSAWIVSGIATP
jgi:hypothetical protein